MKKKAYTLRRRGGRRAEYYLSIMNRGGVKPLFRERYRESCIQMYAHLYSHKEGLTEQECLQRAERTVKENEDNGRTVLPRIVVCVSNKCTLRCKECSELIPYMKEKKDFAAEELIGDLEKLLANVDECVVLEFIGGEPLLHKQLPVLMEYALNDERIRMVEITTNGTVLPDQELLPYLGNKKTLLQISDYGKLTQESKGRLLRLLEENQIEFVELQLAQWYSFGNDNLEKRGRPVTELMYNLYYCNDSKICRMLYMGKLFVCSRAAGLYELGKECSETCYLEVRGQKEGVSPEELYRFFTKTYAKACDHCDYSKDGLCVIPVAEQL